MKPWQSRWLASAWAAWGGGAAAPRRPAIEALLLRPARDEAERRRCLAQPCSLAPPALGPRLSLGGARGQVGLLNLSAAELGTRSGRRRARLLVLAALEGARQQGIGVVGLPATLQRLFGRTGAALRTRFPELVLSTGINGTACLLGQELERTLQASGLRRPRVLVLGACQPLGQAVAERLQAQGHAVLAWGPGQVRLQVWAQRSGIPVRASLEQLAPVDVVLACGAGPVAQGLVAKLAQLPASPGRPLLLLDAAQPAALDAAGLRACAGRLWHQQIGQGQAPGLRLGLAWPWRAAAMVPAAHAEALALAQLLARQPHSVRARNWFEPGAAQQFLVARAFAELGVDLPAPRSFGRPVQIPRLAGRPADSAWPEAGASLP